MDRWEQEKREVVQQLVTHRDGYALVEFKAAKDSPHAEYWTGYIKALDYALEKLGHLTEHASPPPTSNS